MNERGRTESPAPADDAATAPQAASSSSPGAPPTGPRQRLHTPLKTTGRLVAVEPRRVVVPTTLFAATVVSTLYVGQLFMEAYALEVGEPLGKTGTMLDGWPYAAVLLGILLCHEMGHFLAARVHGIPVSLPYFIPIPFFFGTLGAVIRARGRVWSRAALLDLGAVGPLAGMVVAVPCMVVGLALSEVRPLPTEPYQLEGESLLYGLLKRLVVGPIPEGHDVLLHPLAWAAWIGFLVTMINLIPVGQLDGGHIAYALLGHRYALVSRWAHRGLVGLGIGTGTYFGLQAVLAGRDALGIAAEFAAGGNWLLWAAILWVMSRVTRGHPPLDAQERLTPGRIALGSACVLLFILLFMWVPLRAVTP